jgi:hypothetical protein
MEVPSDCVGYVTGRQGQALRSIEEECGSLMFFASKEKVDKCDATQKKMFFLVDSGGMCA